MISLLRDSGELPFRHPIGVHVVPKQKAPPRKLLDSKGPRRFRGPGLPKLTHRVVLVNFDAPELERTTLAGAPALQTQIIWFILPFCHVLLSVYLTSRRRQVQNIFVSKKNNSIARGILVRIRRGGGDRLWTYADFAKLPTFAVAATLSRLAKKGVLRRVRKGLYYVPRTTRFGETSPDPTRVAAAVLNRRGIDWSPTGPAAYNGLGLTTQVSPTTTLAVNRRVGNLAIGPTIRLRVRPYSAQRAADPRVRTLFDALRDIRRIPDNSPREIILKVRDLFSSRKLSFNRVARLAKKEPPRVRAILGAIGSSLRLDPKVLADLKKSLNPTTTFRLGVGEVLPTAHAWGIR